jgi:hypothetical protein
MSVHYHGGGYGYGGGSIEILLSVGVAVGTRVLVGEGGCCVGGIAVELGIGAG